MTRPAQQTPASTASEQKVHPTVTSPPARVVSDFHKYDDLNSRPEAHHHSVGLGSGEASPGRHNHDGTTSLAPLDGITFIGSKSTQTASVLGQVIAALGAFGAKDATTP